MCIEHGMSGNTTLKSARNYCVVRTEPDGSDEIRLPFRSSSECDLRRLRAGYLRPVHCEEDSLFWVLRADASFLLRGCQPGSIDGHGKGEWSWASGTNVDEAVTKWSEVIEGDRGRGAIVT